MGRIRTIKPEFHSHELLSSLPPETHLLAAALTNYADDEGYFNAHPKLVEGGTNPLRRDKTSVAESLRKLEEIGYIRIATCPDGRQLGHIVTFLIHQRVSNPSQSKFREPFTKHYGNPPVKLSPEEEEERKRKEEEEKEAARVAAAAALGPLLGTLPLNDGTEHSLHQSDLDRDQQLYPAVDVLQAYRKMKGHLMANPQRLKTKQGIRRFINTWLSRDQDNAGRSSHHASNRDNRTAAERRRDNGIAALRQQHPDAFAGFADGAAQGMDDCVVPPPGSDGRGSAVLDSRLV